MAACDTGSRPAWPGAGRCSASTTPSSSPWASRCSCCSTARKRRRLLQPGPYLALAIGLSVFSPVLIWNARHGWVSFLFQGGARWAAGCPARTIWRARCWPRPATCSPGSGSRWSSCWCAAGGDWPRARRRPRAALALRGRRPAVGVHGGGLLPAGPAPLGPDRPGVALPDAGPGVGRTTRARPAAGRRRLTVYAGLSLSLIVLTILEYRTGCFQRGGGDALGHPGRADRPDARSLRLGPGGRSTPAAGPGRRPADASSSPATGIRAPSSLTRWAATGRPSVTTPTTREDSPSGAVRRIGSATTASSSWSGTSRPPSPATSAGGSRRSSPPPSSGSNATASPSAASDCTAASSNASPIPSHSTATLAWHINARRRAKRNRPFAKCMREFKAGSRAVLTPWPRSSVRRPTSSEGKMPRASGRVKELERSKKESGK